MSDPQETQDIRILVADDEETIRTVVREVLLEDGYEVTAAASGERALQEFRKEPFPIVLTDIVMGNMSGLELLEEVKSANSDTLVIVMTSHASLETATRALRAGAYDFLIKPFENLDAITALANRAAEKVRSLRRSRQITEELQKQATDLSLKNTALVKLADSLKDYANKDGLTGLFNHRLFREALIRQLNEVRKSRAPLSVIFMDVDHFKAFNDSNGHLAGDEVLRKVAQIVSGQISEPGIVARYGGEELVALVPDVTKDRARELADRVRGLVESEPFEGRESQPLGKVTLSLGVASFPEDGDDADTLIDHADQAVYEAKDRGRNTVCG